MKSPYKIYILLSIFVKNNIEYVQGCPIGLAYTSKLGKIIDFNSSIEI